MKQLLILNIFISLFLDAFAQSGSISGKITDSSYKYPQGLATVTVFRAVDTTIITYRLSNTDGTFKIPGLPLNVPLRFMVTYSGFDAYRKDFTLTENLLSQAFDSVALQPSSRQLDDVMVFAERPPVMIKKDTVEFNASAFKTLPNALVEDLLKKLPGVQVDADGNIMVNGKPVNRILVDGKTFFGDAPQMATRNLPANVIDKIQVTDDKEEMLRNGDDNLNRVGKVVNITLKKGVKKGWFGKMYAGGGTDGRYEGGGIANIYRDTLQVSVLGYINNLNKPGFTYSELLQAGGLDRTRSNLASNSTSIWNNGSGSGISINGVNFGGAQNVGGIATSKGVGFNMNHAPNAKRSIFLQYFNGNIHVDRTNRTEVSQYNVDTVTNNNTVLTGDVVTHAHNIGAGAKLKPDSLTNILINANYTIGIMDEDRISSINAINNKFGQLSFGNINQENLVNSYYYRHGLSLTRMSKSKKGRRFTFAHNLDINKKNTDFTTDALTKFIYPMPADSILNQLRRERLPRTDIATGFTYSEPLSKSFILRFSGRHEFGKSQNIVTTFNKGVGSEYDKINILLSSSFVRTSNRVNTGVGFEFKWKDFTITPAIRTLWQQVNNNLVSSNMPIKQEQFNVLPGFSLVYKQLNINYDKGITLPSYTYLIPVTDNSNPYYISKSNPNLISAQRHNISVNYFYNDPKKSLNVGLNGGGSFIKNDIIQNIVLDNRGVQTTTPTNANGTRNFWLNYNINKQYKNKQKFIFSWNTGAYYSYDRTRLLFNNEKSWQNTFYINQWAGINMNWNDKFEWNTNYSIGYNFTKYTSKAFNKLEVLSHYLNNEFIVRWPKHVIWETNVNYAYSGNIPAGQPKSVTRWNAAINFTMLKNEAGVLRISAYDLLNRNNSVRMNVNRNMITTNITNVLSQYFMATFTYNIRAAGASKKVGGQKLLLF